MIPSHPFSVAAILLNTSVERYPIDVNRRYINFLRAEQKEFCHVGSALISSGNGAWCRMTLGQNTPYENFGTRTGILGMGEYLHPTEHCGMQLLIHAWDNCFFRQSSYMSDFEPIKDNLYYTSP